MLDEGYIKFQANWIKKEVITDANICELNHWRQEMHRLSLIGAYSNGIGYGNISQRIGKSNQFYISGSKTGNFKRLSATHYAIVQSVEISNNSLTCKGLTIASSESMSHAVIYEECNWVQGVIHVHHLGLWKKLLHKVPTTAKSVPYGSPEMAYSIVDLLRNKDTQVQQIFVMEGHEEGIFAFGKDLEAAAAVIKYWLTQYNFL
ncbi:MAG: class II aldolase/adducin family protein [Bacteroidota bacterium]